MKKVLIKLTSPKNNKYAIVDWNTGVVLGYEYHDIPEKKKRRKKK